MIRIEMEAESFDALVKNLCAMIDKMGALEVQEVHSKYRLTYSLLWKKMQEYDDEFGMAASSDLMMHKYNATTLSELPLDEWNAFYSDLMKRLDDKHYEQQTEDLLKELAW